MTFLQGFFLLFFLFALGRTAHQFFRRRVPAFWALAWATVWLGAGIVVLLPQTADMLARFAGVGRGADMIMYLALVLLFYLLFRLYAKLEGVEREISVLVRKIALASSKEEDEKI
jgi:hypothetical protein